MMDGSCWSRGRCFLDYLLHRAPQIWRLDDFLALCRWHRMTSVTELLYSISRLGDERTWWTPRKYMKIPGLLQSHSFKYIDRILYHIYHPVEFTYTKTLIAASHVYCWWKVHANYASRASNYCFRGGHEISVPWRAIANATDTAVPLHEGSIWCAITEVDIFVCVVKRSVQCIGEKPALILFHGCWRMGNDQLSEHTARIASHFPAIPRYQLTEDDLHKVKGLSFDACEVLLQFQWVWWHDDIAKA